jgi:hypothetical protein
MSVSAEAYGVLNPYKEIAPVVHSKSEEERRRLSLLLKDVFIFSYLSDLDFGKIIDALKKEEFS